MGDLEVPRAERDAAVSRRKHAGGRAPRCEESWLLIRWRFFFRKTFWERPMTPGLVKLTFTPWRTIVQGDERAYANYNVVLRPVQGPRRFSPRNCVTRVT